MQYINLCNDQEHNNNWPSYDRIVKKKHTSVVITERRVRSNTFRHDIALVLAQILRFNPRSCTVQMVLSNDMHEQSTSQHNSIPIPQSSRRTSADVSKMAHLLRRCVSLRLFDLSRRTLDQRRIERLCSESLFNRPSISWTQFVSLRRYSTETVAGSVLEGVEEESKRSSEKGLRLSDSCVKVCTVFNLRWSVYKYIH